MAEAAAKEKTGARGLLTVFEKLFRDYKYYLAGSGLSQLRVSAELVREPKRVLDRLMAEGHKHEEARSNTTRSNSPINSRTSTGSRLFLMKRRCGVWSSARKAERMTMPDLCAHLFKDYQFGLSLIKKNTGRQTFVLTEAAVRCSG